MPDRKIRTDFWSTALLWLPAGILSGAILAALSYPFWFGPAARERYAQAVVRDLGVLSYPLWLDSASPTEYVQALVRDMGVLSYPLAGGPTAVKECTQAAIRELQALDYPRRGGHVSPGVRDPDEPELWVRNPVHKYHYVAIVRYPYYPHHGDQWHRRDRDEFLASKGVPPEGRDFKSCRAGAKEYLKDWWQHHCANRLSVDERADAETLEHRIWHWLRVEEGRICAPARGLDFDLDEIRGPLPPEAVARHDRLWATLSSPDLHDPDYTRRLFLMVLITPHTVETIEKLANWLDGVEDGPFQARSGWRPSLKAELWRHLLRDSKRRAMELLRERCVSGVVEQAVYLLFVDMALDGSVDPALSDDEFQQIIRRAPTDKALEHALRHIQSKMLTSRGRRYSHGVGFLADIACDPRFPLSRRRVVARAIPDLADDHELCKRVVRLPSGPESARLKMSILDGRKALGPGCVPAYLVRELALLRGESDAVRRMAIGLLCRELAWWQRRYKKTGDDGQRQMMLCNLAALRAIAESPDEKPELRELAASGIIEPATKIE